MAKDTYIQVRISEEMKQKVQSASETRGLSMSTLIMLALRDYLPELRQSTREIKKDFDARNKN